MSKHLGREMERLQRTVLGMAGRVEESLANALIALRERDAAAVGRVTAGEDEVDRLENEVHEECLKILALYQPVAIDLRRVVAVLQIATDLERIGDLAVAVAERAEATFGKPYVAVPARLTDMADRAVAMLHAALDAFVHLDPAAAREVIRQDASVDRDNDELIRGLVEEMKRGPELIETALSLFSAVRHVERVADHATNIAEGVVYLAEGDIVRHRPERVWAKGQGAP